MHNLSPLATTKSLDAVVTVGDTFDDSARSSPRVVKFTRMSLWNNRGM